MRKVVSRQGAHQWLRSARRRGRRAFNSLIRFRVELISEAISPGIRFQAPAKETRGFGRPEIRFPTSLKLSPGRLWARNSAYASRSSATDVVSIFGIYGDRQSD